MSFDTASTAYPSLTHIVLLCRHPSRYRSELTFFNFDDRKERRFHRDMVERQIKKKIETEINVLSGRTVNWLEKKGKFKQSARYVYWYVVVINIRIFPSIYFTVQIYESIPKARSMYSKRGCHQFDLIHALNKMLNLKWVFFCAKFSFIFSLLVFDCLKGCLLSSLSRFFSK